MSTPEALEQGQRATWMWLCKIKALHMCWLALVALGAKGGKKLENIALGGWDMAPNVKGDIHRANRLQNAFSWHLCDTPMPHYEFSTVAASRC